jgi:hypothetical protein
MEPKHPLDLVYRDPAGLAPLCDEEEFAADLTELVADEAPRLFAVVQEYGERVDARIAAWGMAFDDHAEVAEGGAWMSLRRPESALRRYKRGSFVHARLVWVDPSIGPDQ